MSFIRVVSMKRKRKQMKLAPLARDLAMTFGDEEKYIDFHAAGLYLPAAQVVLSVVVSSTASIVCCWITSPRQTCAVRTLAITSFCGVLFVRRPLKVAQAKGVNTVFTALRMAAFIYIFALTIEQILHSCSPEDTIGDYDFMKRLLYHVCMAFTMVAGFVRARAPRSEHDGAFWMSTLSLLVVAIVPPPAVPGTGPLCSAATLFAAGERLLRAFLFASIYCTLVYCSAPVSNNLADQLVCIARSTAASIWALGIHVLGLIFAPIQIFILLYVSFGNGIAQLQYDHVEMGMDQSPLPMSLPISNMPVAETIEDTEPRGMPFVPVQSMNGGGLRFNLSSANHSGPGADAKFAAAVARVAEES